MALLVAEEAAALVLGGYRSRPHPDKKGRHEELGRGGRYICGDSEPATGLTLYPDAILRVAPPRQARPRVFVPFGADRNVMAGLRAEGFATVAALAPVVDDIAEATRLGCSYILRAGKAALLHTEG